LFTNVQPNPPGTGGFAGNLDAVEAAGVLETSLAAVEVERVFIKTSRKTIDVEVLEAILNTEEAVEVCIRD
jgi:hypothetical protein